MATSWLWDAHRGGYYYPDFVQRAFVYQNGGRVPMDGPSTAETNGSVILPALWHPSCHFNIDLPITASRTRRERIAYMRPSRDRQLRQAARIQSNIS